MIRRSTLKRPHFGFTLIELLVGVLITSAITGATVIAISQVLRAKTVGEARRQAFSRAQVGVQSMASDLENLIRDGDLYNARVVITDSANRDQPADGLLLFIKSLQPTRPLGAQAEGDHFESQYRLQADERPAPAARGSQSKTPGAYVLWRRVDPIPDEVPDGGGLAYPLVDHAYALSVEGFDGRNWLPTWDSDRDGYPHAVRVSVTATSDDGSARWTARRTVAIDRVPTPLATLGQNATTSAGGSTTK